MDCIQIVSRLQKVPILIKHIFIYILEKNIFWIKIQSVIFFIYSFIPAFIFTVQIFKWQLRFMLVCA